MSKSGNLPILLLAAGLAAAPGEGWAKSDTEIGTVAAVNRDMDGTPPSAASRALGLGMRIVRDERIETSEIGSGQLLFLDQTSLGLAPNSDLVLDSYVYDAETQRGEMALSLTRGALRFVGGRISKNRDVTIRTPSATIGIRGGLCIIEVSEDGVTNVVQVAGEYTTIVGTSGRSVTLSRPNATATSTPDGEVTYRGLLDADGLAPFQKKFEGNGNGDSKQASSDKQVEQESRRVSEVNSGNSDGAERHPVSTSGEKQVAGPGGGGEDPPPHPPQEPDTTDPQPGATPSAGAFFTPSSGFSGFNSIARGSLIGTTSGGDTIRIPVAEDTTDFVSSIAGNPVPTYFAQSLSPNSGFVEFTSAAGGMSSTLGPISGFGFSDLDNDFHLYQFDTSPGGGPVEHGIILFGNPSPGQAAAFAGDDGFNIAPTANTVSLYQIEPDLNPLGGGGAPPLGLFVISNGGEARFAHASTSLPSGVGGRVLVAEAQTEIDGGTGLQISDFSVFAAPIEESPSGGPRIAGTVFATSVAGNQRFIDTPNLGTFEDNQGNSVFGPDDRYIVVSSVHRPGGSGPLTLDPGTFHELGLGDQPLEPSLNLLTRDAAADFIADDPLVLANDATSRTGLTFGRPGAFDAVFATGMALCSTGSCGTQFTSAGFSGTYALTSALPLSGTGGHFDFQNLGSPSGPDSNTFGFSLSLLDALDLGNIQRASGTPEVTYQFGFGATVNDVSAYVDDGHFGASADSSHVVDGQTAAGRVMLASSGLASDAGVIPGFAGPPPEFLRWGWWSANMDITENGGALREDLVHMGTWVAGLRPDVADLPTTGIANYAGFAVGTDADLQTGTTAIVGGDFSLNYDFGQAQGTFNLNIAGHGFSGVPVFADGDNPEFVAYGGFESRSSENLLVEGAFFSGGGDPVAATGGQFVIDDLIGDRQVVGVYGGDKTGGGGGP